MDEIRGDIWSYHADGNWIVIPTNGSVNRDGRAVMGRGLALQAALRFSGLPRMLADHLGRAGNRVFTWPEFALFTFPVKHRWSEAADLELIRRSASELAFAAGVLGRFPVYVPRVGCGNGHRGWDEVRPILNDRLGLGFKIIQLPGMED